MDQVKGSIALGETGGEIPASQIHGDDLHAGMRRPGASSDLTLGTDKAAHAIAFLQQARRETATDVAGGAGDRDARRGWAHWDA